MKTFEIPDDWDIPEQRKNRTLCNACWLQRNAAIRNWMRGDFKEVMDKVQEEAKLLMMGGE